MRSDRPHTRSKYKRRGAAVLVALSCLTAVMMLGLTALKYGLSQRDEIRAEGRAMQAALLADSAIARAAVRLSDDGTYRGETWKIPPSELGDRWSAEVTIEVVPLAQESQQVTIRATAEYPAGQLHCVRTTLTAPFRLPAAKDSL